MVLMRVMCLRSKSRSKLRKTSAETILWVSCDGCLSDRQPSSGEIKPIRSQPHFPAMDDGGCSRRAVFTLEGRLGNCSNCFVWSGADFGSDLWWETARQCGSQVLKSCSKPNLDSLIVGTGSDSEYRHGSWYHCLVAGSGKIFNLCHIPAKRWQNSPNLNLPTWIERGGVRGLEKIDVVIRVGFLGRICCGLLIDGGEAVWQAIVRRPLKLVNWVRRMCGGEIRVGAIKMEFVCFGLTWRFLEFWIA